MFVVEAKARNRETASMLIYNYSSFFLLAKYTLFSWNFFQPGPSWIVPFLSKLLSNPI